MRSLSRRKNRQIFILHIDYGEPIQPEKSALCKDCKFFCVARRRAPLLKYESKIVEKMIEVDDEKKQINRIHVEFEFGCISRCNRRIRRG